MRLTDLTVRYGSRTVVARLPLEIPPSRIIGPPGESGSGKSTVAPACQNENRPATFTRTQGCLRGAVPLTALRNGVPFGNATFKILQEVELLPTKNHFTVSTEISLVGITGLSPVTLASLDEDCWPTTGCTELVGPWTGSTT